MRPRGGDLSSLSSSLSELPWKLFRFDDRERVIWAACVSFSVSNKQKN